MGNLVSSVGFRSAQSSGLSPSPTEETGPKALPGQDTHAEEELKSSITEEKPPEEPESNDTSYGVEATAVRTLAASTGTVAILGTTAKVKESNESGDSRTSPVQSSPNELVPSSELTSVEVIIPSHTQSTSDKNGIKDKIEDEVKTDQEVSSVTPAIKNDREEKEGAKSLSIETSAATENTEELSDEKNIKESETKKSEEAEIEQKGPINEADIKEESKAEELKLSDEPKIIASSETLETSSEVEHPSIVEHLKKQDESDSTINFEKAETDTPPIIEKSETSDEVKLPAAIDKKEHISDEGEKESEKANATEIGGKAERSDGTNLTPAEEKVELKDHTNILPNSISGSVVEKEPVKIRDRAHEPKIVEEMSVKKEEKLTHSEEMVKEKQLELNLPGEQDSKGEIRDLPITLEKEGEISLTSIEITPEEEIKVTSESEPVSPEASKTEEDNEISSEQLKTNSLSDMSLSETLNSEYEEAVREAAKAQELKEMVASLSATANRPTLDYEVSEESSSSKDVSRNDTTVGTSLQDSEELERTISQPSRTDPYNIPEKQETMSYKIHESDQNIPVATSTILEAAEDIGSSSENSSEEKELNKIEVEEKTKYTSEPKINGKKTEDDTLEEKEKDETEVEVESIENNESESKIEIKSPDKVGSPTIEEVEKFTEDKEQNEKKNENEVIVAATTIQSGFRGYQVRKKMKESEDVKEVKQIAEQEETEKSSSDDAKTLDGEMVSSTSNFLCEKGQLEKQEKHSIDQSEPKTPEVEIPPTEPNEESDIIKYVPESLIKIAQAEVDKICKEAEKATESLMTPPAVKDDEELEESEIQDEDFPAPPDELLRSESKTEETKDDHSSSGTQTTEPTMPLGNNHTEGDSSKTEDTTAPSLAESEMPKSTAQTPSQQNQELKLESSATENINTEVAALQRDSTEGELTMEEDSTRDDDLSPATHSNKVEDENKNEDKAATVIQAGYRGFKTRKRLREEEPSTEDPQDEELKIESTQHEKGSEENSNSNESEQSSVDSCSKDKSDKELNDSAKKIQAGVRGYLVRKRQKVKRDAAVTIQSHFRGFKTRQRLKQESQ